MFLRLQNAVCCEDHLHCCPSGYTCDVKDGRCNKGDVSLPFYKKIAATPKINKENVGTECPGGGAECPTGIILKLFLNLWFLFYLL